MCNDSRELKELLNAATRLMEASSSESARAATYKANTQETLRDLLWLNALKCASREILLQSETDAETDIDIYLDGAITVPRCNEIALLDRHNCRGKVSSAVTQYHNDLEEPSLGKGPIIKFGSSGGRRKTCRTGLCKTSSRSYERRHLLKCCPSLSQNTSIHRDVSDISTIDHHKIVSDGSSRCPKIPTTIQHSKPWLACLANICTNPCCLSVSLSPGNSPRRCHICILLTGCIQEFTAEMYCSSAMAIR